MFDPIDIVMLGGAVALAAKGISDYFTKKENIEKHKKQLKQLEELIKKQEAELNK